VTHVLFWDIDGTLLTTNRAGIFAWEQAAGEVTGQSADFAELPTAGLTDREIAVEALKACGVAPGPEPVARLLRAYERWLPERLSWRAGHVMPGVREILDACRSRPDVHHLLLTGNLRSCAVAKLRHYGLEAYFAEGAFAEDARDRAGIARRALALATERLGASLPTDHLYVIGDTPHDVHCGQAIGARVIAVATGTYSAAELREHRPWCTVEQLPDPGAFARLLQLVP
jgi:phosphoglycolate phosphatase